MNQPLPTERVAELPPVVNVPLAVNVSASQVKLYDRCARLWWLNYVAGVRQNRLQHFVLGHALHSVGERFLLGHATNEADLYPPKWNEGLTEDESAWINRATRHAIETGVWQLLTDAYVEFPILFLTGEHHVDARGLPLLAAAKTYEDEKGVRRHSKPDTLIDGSPLPSDWDATPPFVGFIDLLKLGINPAIIDHKTAKNRRYATTASKLTEDAQVLSYAAVPMVLDPSVKLVRMRHNVFLKSEDTKIAYAVDAPAPLERVVAQWQHNRAIVQEMVSLRTHFPKVEAASRFHRAKNWLKVRSAIDERRPDACNDYGGCPFRDACSGHCSVETVVQRLDAPPPPGFVVIDDDARKPRTFGLNLAVTAKTSAFPLQPPRPPSPPKDTTMFTAPKLSAGADAYVIDPSNAGQQYRCRLLTDADAQGTLSIALWPNADVMPDFASLGPIYRTDVLASVLLSVPAINAGITGYADELAKHPEVTAASVAWQPAAPVSPIASATTAKAIQRDPPDGRFGLAGVPAAVAATVAPKLVAAAPVAVPALPETPAGFTPVAVGTVLRVSATDHPFWSKLKGKLAKVIAPAGPGERPGSVLYTVEIDGGPYPDVDAMRFEPVPVALPPGQVSALAQSIVGLCMTLVGQDVSVKFKVDGSDNVTTVNAKLESAFQQGGIVLLNGALKIDYDKIESIQPLVEAGIPGIKLPKGNGKVLEMLDSDTAKAQVKRTKEQAKAAKAAGEAADTNQGLADLTQGKAGASTSQSLDTAIDLIVATLNGGKVTRKVLETLAPLLAGAKEYQVSLEAASLTGAPAAGDVSAFTVLSADVTRLRSHFAGQLTDIATRLADAANEFAG